MRFKEKRYKTVFTSTIFLAVSMSLFFQIFLITITVYSSKTWTFDTRASHTTIQSLDSQSSTLSSSCSSMGRAQSWSRTSSWYWFSLMPPQCRSFVDFGLMFLLFTGWNPDFERDLDPLGMYGALWPYGGSPNPTPHTPFGIKYSLTHKQTNKPTN